MAPNKAHALAILLTLLPVAFAAYLVRSRAVFFLGVLGAVCGVVFLAPVATMDFSGDATELDRIWAYALVDLQGSLPAAAIGVVVGWIPTPRERRTRNSRPFSMTRTEESGIRAGSR
jgi:hypothetical protein